MQTQRLAGYLWAVLMALCGPTISNLRVFSLSKHPSSSDFVIKIYCFYYLKLYYSIYRVVGFPIRVFWAQFLFIT